MKRLLVLIAMFSLAACQQPDGGQSGNADALQNAQTEIARLEKENASLITEKVKENAAKVNVAKKKPKAEIEAPTGYYTEADEAAADAAQQAGLKAYGIDAQKARRRKLCWQDYCPCEPGQDGQGMEASLCRNLKDGVGVDDDVMAAASVARDARRKLRDFNQQNPSF